LIVGRWRGTIEARRGDITLTQPAIAPSSTPVETVIAVHALTRRYGDLTAVAGVSFEVRRGEVFGILGPNGAGKTTLVEMLEGLTVPTAGDATVLGLDIRRDTVRIKERIGVQLQASSYPKYLTLLELLRLFGSFYPQSADAALLLARVGLADRARSRVGQLSGGMAQRFSIVAALVNDPDIVFLDEPTAGLDPDARRSLWSLIQEVRAEGTTVVLTTHYMEEAELLCDRVAILDRGAIVALDTPSALVRTLHAPYRVRALASAPLDLGAVAALPGVSEIAATERPDGHELTLRAQVAPALTAGLLALAERQGATLRDLTVTPATLEDVFLGLTGRRLDEAIDDTGIAE